MLSEFLGQGKVTVVSKTSLFYQQLTKNIWDCSLQSSEMWSCAACYIWLTFQRNLLPLSPGQMDAAGSSEISVHFY
jgi:hypothetical protein